MMRATAIELGQLQGFHDLEPAVEEFRAAVLGGLSGPQKRLPAKFFYDAEGSRLFDGICDLPEYYPTRTEIGILRDNAGEIAGAIGPDATLVEFGSGSSVKIRTLLDALSSLAAYVPIDISRDHLVAAARALAADYEGLAVVPVCADYSGPVVLPPNLPRGRLTGFFPGSTIGNFAPTQAAAFLKQVAKLLGPGSGLLIGVDLQKDAGILHAAYNDSRGVTAEFNINLLARINRELEGDFALDGFDHHACFNAARACIEMHLVSNRHQKATVAGRTFEFQHGETIHTEDSHKYTVESFHALAAAAGWRAETVWTDPDRLFSVHYLVACI
jgi:dimethylhistidine N-methyltransferase